MADTVTWKGPDDLRLQLAPVAALRTHPDNPRRGDVKRIAASLEAFGQLAPIIVHDLDGTDTIFAGNHTYRAAVEELGWTHIAVSRPDYLTADEADRYLLMDNASADHATYDYQELTAILDELTAAGRLAHTTVTTSELAGMKAEAEAMARAALREQEFSEARDSSGSEPPPATVAPPEPLLRQMLLTFRPPETFDGFANRLQSLRKEYGTDDISSTIREAVRREHAKVMTA